MKKSNLAASMILAIILVILPAKILAAEDLAVLQVYMTGQTMTVITNSEMNAGSLNVMVSNQNTEITSTGRLSGNRALIRTTVLVNLSTAVPSAARGRLIETLELMIEHKLPNEEFKIITFGEGQTLLQDFTADRFDLAAAVRQISFDNRNSWVYDAVYTTMPDIVSIDGRPVFHRTIVFSHGIGTQAAGVTWDELFLRLQQDRYPIDVVSVSAGVAAENIELSLISRISGGRYFPLHANTNARTLANSLGVGDFFYIEATVPIPLLDGVTRQVDITDNAESIRLDVRFSVYAPAGVPVQPGAAAEATPTPEPAAALPQPVLPTVPQVPTPAETFGVSIPMIIIGVGVVLLIVVILVAVSISVRSKKKSPVQYDDYFPESSQPSIHDITTEYIGTSAPQVDFSAPQVDFAGTDFTIKISSPNDASKTWDLPVRGDLLVGRAAHCVIMLDDASVGREQCKIVIDGPNLAVVNLSSTNKTMLNGNRISDRALLQTGDTLTLGRDVLRVDYIQTPNVPPPVQMHSDSVDRQGNTESIF